MVNVSNNVVDRFDTCFDISAAAVVQVEKDIRILEKAGTGTK